MSITEKLERGAQDIFLKWVWLETEIGRAINEDLLVFVDTESVRNWNDRSGIEVMEGFFELEEYGAQFSPPHQFYKLSKNKIYSLREYRMFSEHDFNKYVDAFLEFRGGSVRFYEVKDD